MKHLEYHLKTNALAAAALLTIGFLQPAMAQRSCPASATSLRGNIAKPDTAARIEGFTLGNRSADRTPLAIVAGEGRGTLTDPDGQKFTHQFEISAVIRSNGSAHGEASFVFPMQFSQKWGAVAGVDLIRLKGDFKSGSVDSAGNISLTGPFVETDYSRGEGIVYQEDSSVSGAAPIEIVVAPDARAFTLTWCDFIPGVGYFSIVVSKGHLMIR
jgi:hypothetical protein